MRLDEPAAGLLKCVKIGKFLRFRREDVEASCTGSRHERPREGARLGASCRARQRTARSSAHQAQRALPRRQTNKLDHAGQSTHRLLSPGSVRKVFTVLSSIMSQVRPARVGVFQRGDGRARAAGRHGCARATEERQPADGARAAPAASPAPGAHRPGEPRGQRPPGGRPVPSPGGGFIRHNLFVKGASVRRSRRRCPRTSPGSASTIYGIRPRRCCADRRRRATGSRSRSGWDTAALDHA